MRDPKTLSKTEKKRIREVRRYTPAPPKKPETPLTPEQAATMKAAILKNMRAVKPSTTQLVDERSGPVHYRYQGYVGL